MSRLERAISKRARRAELRRRYLLPVGTQLTEVMGCGYGGVGCPGWPAAVHDGLCVPVRIPVIHCVGCGGHDAWGELWHDEGCRFFVGGAA